MDMEATVLTEILIIFPSIFLKILRSARRRRFPPFRDTLSYNRPPPPPEAAASPHSIPPLPDSWPNRISQVGEPPCLRRLIAVAGGGMLHYP
nr:hypothetical protein Itr_chr10CG15630 [Ipomoea trifida]GMD42486.1 hypothetical protein Iba_chr10bCG9790 [Ipomoea batatas]GMD45635.1 hypothetical protein Iba_chr10dCG11980 [Ipomoea batatas]GME05376.1 hypothetical protein Iba_scaffold2820CG0280 [Ipomoea batatas]